VSRKVLPVHRWLGITVGLLFALWFASGSILSFVPFPSLAAAIGLLFCSTGVVIGVKRLKRSHWS
jgi:hypothetical protein